MAFGADWNFDYLEELIQERGDQVVWETALACPTCRRGDATAAFNEKNATEVTNLRNVHCPSCHGESFVYRNARVVTGLLTQVNAGARQITDAGTIYPGDCTFSPSFAGPDMEDMDKVTLCVTDVLNEGQVIQRNAAYLSNARLRPTDLATTEDRLWYNSDGCVIWCEDQNNVVYTNNADFLVIDNLLRWIGNRPNDGVFYTIKYHYYPEWIVYASPFQRVDRGRDLKQKVMLRKKHVVFLNSTATSTATMRQAEQVRLTGRTKV